MPTLSVTPHFLNINVSTKVCDVTDYGAKGNGKTLDTDAIQAALDECGSHDGGGTVLIPAGAEYLSQSIEFTGDNTRLEIESGATLRFDDDRTTWPYDKKGKVSLLSEVYIHTAHMHRSPYYFGRPGD